MNTYIYIKANDSELRDQEEAAVSYVFTQSTTQKLAGAVVSCHKSYRLSFTNLVHSYYIELIYQ